MVAKDGRKAQYRPYSIANGLVREGSDAYLLLGAVRTFRELPLGTCPSPKTDVCDRLRRKIRTTGLALMPQPRREFLKRREETDFRGVYLTHEVTLGGVRDPVLAST